MFYNIRNKIYELYPGFKKGFVYKFIFLRDF